LSKILLFQDYAPISEIGNSDVTVAFECPSAKEAAAKKTQWTGASLFKLLVFEPHPKVVTPLISDPSPNN
jgi:hypothetical protein